MNVFDEEYWATVWQFPNYKISSFGTIWDKDFDEEVIPTFNRASGEMRVNLKYDASEFKGAVWKLLYATFWKEGWGINVDVSYRDDDPRNLSIFNLMFNLKSGMPLMFRIDEKTGIWARRRRKSRAVLVVETGERYESVRELAKVLNGSANTIYMCLRGTQGSHKGHTFEWTD